MVSGERRPAAGKPPPELRPAYEECLRLARSHYENFPVASWLLPAPMRPHVAALYAFARQADDAADEGTFTAKERLARLDEFGQRLVECVAETHPRLDTPDDWLFAALGHSIRACHLPPSLFAALLSAFAQDVVTTRYDAWTDVDDYCRRSANPVGRLVLRIAGVEDARLDESSDALCSALQLTNFWQDLERDWGRGRLYVPAEEYERFGARPDDLRRPLSPSWKATMAAATARTRRLFDRGRAVCDGVTGRLRYELRLTWLGGMRVLERLNATWDRADSRRRRLEVIDAIPIVWKALAWPRDPLRAASR